MFGISVEKTAGGFTVDIGRAEVSVCRDPLVSPRFGFELLRGDGWRWWAMQVGRTFIGISVEEAVPATGSAVRGRESAGAAI